MHILINPIYGITGLGFNATRWPAPLSLESFLLTFSLFFNSKLSSDSDNFQIKHIIPALKTSINV